MRFAARPKSNGKPPDSCLRPTCLDAILWGRLSACQPAFQPGPSTTPCALLARSRARRAMWRGHSCQQRRSWAPWPEATLVSKASAARVYSPPGRVFNSTVLLLLQQPPFPPAPSELLPTTVNGHRGRLCRRPFLSRLIPDPALLRVTPAIRVLALQPGPTAGQAAIRGTRFFPVCA